MMTIPDQERQYPLRVTPDGLERAAGTALTLWTGDWLWLLSLVPIVALFFVQPMKAAVIGIAIVAYMLTCVVHVLKCILSDTSRVSALKQKEHDLW